LYSCKGNLYVFDLSIWIVFFSIIILLIIFRKRKMLGGVQYRRTGIIIIIIVVERLSTSVITITPLCGYPIVHSIDSNI
jgi:hypothetical protein